MAQSPALQAHIQGLREAKAAFQRLPEITRDAMNDATELTLREIVRAAQDRLRSNPSIQTRALLDAVAFTLNLKNGRGRAGIKSGTSGHVRGSNWAKDVPSHRAHFIEFGTRHASAEPFMIPAAESQKGPYLDRCRHAGKAIERTTAAIGMAGGGRTL